MTKMRIQPSFLNKWLHQNKAECTGDCVEGCLLDNFVVATKRGYAAIYEHYVNAWESDYRVEFEKGEAPNVFARWDEFVNRAEQSVA